MGEEMGLKEGKGAGLRLVSTKAMGEQSLPGLLVME